MRDGSTRLQAGSPNGKHLAFLPPHRRYNLQVNRPREALVLNA